MQITFGTYDVRVEKKGNQSFVFDIIRKKLVALTPEEWVRQHWLQYLIEEKKYPRSLIAVEYSLQLNELAKRCDIVVFGKSGKPQLIVECKSPSVKIIQKVFDQIARYNLALKVKYLVVSNGKDTFCCEIDFEKNSWKLMEQLPEAIDLI